MHKPGNRKYNMSDKLYALFSNYGVRVWKGLLQKIYHFDKWHVVSLRQRKYARDIIEFCNERHNRGSFVEIGSGLGDIIRNVQYTARYGFDSDDRVLRAASFLNTLRGGNKIVLSPFHFPDSRLSGHFDLILMVNWIHHIEPAVLKANLEEYFNFHLKQEGAIIIDTVQDKEYRYNHDITYLTGDIKASVSKLGNYERQREIWIIKK